MDTNVWIGLAIAVIAFLYSSVGHAGASGYIAVLSLAGLPPAEIRPTALVLNILVATIVVAQFTRAGHFKWELFWPFALLSAPLAFLGGFLKLPADVFKVLVGVVLLFSAVRLLVKQGEAATIRPPKRSTAIAAGGVLGLLSGLTGTGGGIFLTPLLLFAGWAKTREAAAVSALYILMNSMSGLAGFVVSGQAIPGTVWRFVLAAALGGALGAYLGSTTFQVRIIQLILGVVLIVAGGKLVFLL